MLATLTGDEQYHGLTRPMIAFPSGSNRALWPSQNRAFVAEFYLFGDMSLPVRASRDAAFTHARKLAARYGYGVQAVGEDALEVWDACDYDRFRVTYDNQAGQVVNAQSILTALSRLLWP